MTPRQDEIARYAEAVRAALLDIPEADRHELVEDLEDHLAEVAAESAEPLTVRLGPPEAYAAELRTAYGAGGGRSRRSLTTSFDQLKRELDRHPQVKAVWEFFGELMPAWWLARGYLAAMLLWGFKDSAWHVGPWGGEQAFFGVAMALGSAWLGVRARRRRGTGRLRVTLVAANVVTALGITFLWYFGTGVFNVLPVVAYSSETPESSAPPTDSLDGVANIYPYAKDGRPLKDVLLYDQNGRPVQVDYGGSGLILKQICGSPPPPANSFPLPLRDIGAEGDPEACIPAPSPGKTP